MFAALLRRKSPALLGATGLLRQYVHVLLSNRGDPSPRPFGHFPVTPAMLGTANGAAVPTPPSIHGLRWTKPLGKRASDLLLLCFSGTAHAARRHSGTQSMDGRQRRERRRRSRCRASQLAPGTLEERSRWIAIAERSTGTYCREGRREREAQGSPIRRKRIGPPRPAPSLFGYFLGDAKK